MNLNYIQQNLTNVDKIITTASVKVCYNVFCFYNVLAHHEINILNVYISN